MADVIKTQADKDGNLFLFSLFLCCVFNWRHDALVELGEERYTTKQMITTIAGLKHGRPNVKTQDS